MSKHVTPKTKDYTRWYTDVITKEIALASPIPNTPMLKTKTKTKSRNTLIKDAISAVFKATDALRNPLNTAVECIMYK